MRFDKYHGLGNDFIVVDLRGDPQQPDAERVQEPTVVKRICERRFGVGADGVLAIGSAVSEGADASMRVLNADGSEAEMCGNGLRCVAKHLVDLADLADPADPAAAADAGTSELLIDTGAGPLHCQTHQGATNSVASVAVDMGRPHLARGDIPMTGPVAERAVRIAVEGVAQPFTAVSMGNPHAVTFVKETSDALRALAESIGPMIETHTMFPARTNVELARIVSPTEIELVVWERGCGITLACGTGACATVVAAILEGHCNADDTVIVHLLGGDLEIKVASDLSSVLMTGPAEHVFTGELMLGPSR